ncbi:MAG: DUF4010 domain-containing protein [Acetobacteraceae bacterium]|nr:DUF4010 domain-containing protein [Acetobacteraceae bacterium]
MDDPRLLERLGVALAIGLLVGVERHWRERDAAPGKRAAGLRTFGLIGLTGGVAAAVSPDPVWLGLVLLAVVAPVAWFERAEAAASGSVSVTTVTAAALTCALGALAVLGQVTAAAAAAVGAVGLLALRERLHGFVSRLTWPELRSAIVLLAMTLIAMPVIPDREYPELGGLNPARLWLFTVILAGVSFAGYVAARMFGAERGRIAAGALGGLVSSTAVVLASARASRDGQPGAAAAALAAGGVAWVRTALLVGLLAPSVGPRLWPALLAGAAVQAAAALALLARAAPAAAAPPGSGNPLELGPVLRMAALIAAIGLAARAGAAWFGDSGLLAVAAVSGVADTDALIASVSGLLLGGLPDRTGALAIAIALAANGLAKTGYAFALGTAGFGLRYAAGTLLALAVAAPFVLR